MNTEEIIKSYPEVTGQLNERLERYITERKYIELRLDRLRNNKAKEIEEYVKRVVAERPDFFTGYGTMVRKDLEQAYLNKEQELELKLKEIDEHISSIKKSMDIVTSEDKQKNERKMDITEVKEMPEQTIDIESKTIEQLAKEQNLEKVYSHFISRVYSDVIQCIDDRKILKLDGDSDRNLYGVHKTEDDVIREDLGLVGEIKVDLPNGLYINLDDISVALNNYRKKNKGRIFKVDGIDKEYEVNKRTVNRLIEELKNYSTIILLSEKKISFFDIKRVYGKAKADEYNEKVKLGNVKTKMPVGQYINLEELKYNLQKLFQEKRQSWLQSFIQSIGMLSKGIDKPKSDKYKLSQDESIKKK